MHNAVPAALIALVASSSSSFAQDDRDAYRENLTKLSVAPSSFSGQRLRVFCPVEQADVDVVTCLVLNKALKTVGREIIIVEAEEASEYIDILDRCSGHFGRSVGDDCSFLIDVFVDPGDGFPMAKAHRFVPVPH